MGKARFKPKKMPRSKKRRIRKDETGLRELECLKLKRKLRIMQNDRKGYGQEISQVVHKQNRELTILGRENREMLRSLNVAYGPVLLRRDIRNTATLRDLADVTDDYRELLAIETQACNETDAKISALQEQILVQRKALGGLSYDRTQRVKINRTVTTLENNVNRVTKLFCEQLANNRDTREEIRLLVKQKKLFTDMYNALTKRINSYKKKIVDTTDEASSNYEQRLTAMAKMRTLKERSQKDEVMFNAEMKVLQRLISHDNHIKKFMTVKENERVEFKAEEATKRAKMCVEEKALAEESQHVNKYDVLFTNIREVTGERNIDRVVKNFKAKDAENFGRFDYVSELNNQVVKLRDDIQRLRDNIKRLRDEDMNSKTGCEGMIASINEKRHSSLSTLEKEMSLLNKANEKVELMCVSIHGMFHSLGCTTEPFTPLLAYEDKVTAGNVLVYLGMLERKCMELILIHQFINLHQDPFGHLMTTPRSIHRIRPRGASKMTLKVYDTPTLPNVITPSVSDDATTLDAHSLAPEEGSSVPKELSSIRETARHRVAEKEATGNLFHQQLFITDKRQKSRMKGPTSPIPSSIPPPPTYNPNKSK